MQTLTPSLISIEDLTKDEILYLLKQSAHLKQNPQPRLLENIILGCCFFEPSTRTRLSFESACLRCGGKVLGFDEVRNTSAAKGESFLDTMQMMEGYADLVVIRHPLEGAAQAAADLLDIPVINAGDGANQHPTQALVDLFTVQENFASLEGLHIACVGDLKYGRAVHSLIQAFSLFKPRFYFVSPPSLEVPKELSDFLKSNGIMFSFHKTLEEIMLKVDVLYMTRIQQERFADKLEYLRLKGCYQLKKDHLANAKDTLKVLHPLPRVDEIDKEVDLMPHALYMKQAHNGVFVRQALIAHLMGRFI